MTDTADFITPALLARYDKPGPRYTSYPTALEFHDGVGEADYGQRLSLLAEERLPLSMYVHIPFCRSRCHFCGCHTSLCREAGDIETYVSHLCAEVDLLASRLGGAPMPLVALHLGGGTPTYLSDTLMGRIIEKINDAFDVDKNAEISVEVNPAVSSRQQIAFLRTLGFNRISVGVQDFNPTVLEAIGRHQTRAETLDIVDAARNAGFSSVNFDLIYGLPYQTVASFNQTLEEVLAVRPDRVALYSFAYIPWIRENQNRIDETALPGRDDKFAFFANALKRFTRQGYLQIGMDHFALAEDELGKATRNGTLFRNFMGYTVTRSRDTLGVGVSSIGYVKGAFFQNEKENNGYYGLVNNGQLPIMKGLVLSGDDLIRANLITELMCNFRVIIAEFEKRWQIDFATYFAEELTQLAAQREAELKGAELSFTTMDDTLQLTAVGRLFVRNVCMVFDTYLKNKSENRPLFSRTV